MRYLPEFLDRSAQEQVLRDLREAVAQAPLFTPVMPRTAKPFSVRMTNMGPAGLGFRQGGLPLSGQPPGHGNALARHIPKHSGRMEPGFQATMPYPPEACLVNFYGSRRQNGAAPGPGRRGFRSPGGFHFAGRDGPLPRGRHDARRKDAIAKARVGRCADPGRPTRLAFHGIDRVIGGTSTLLKDGGRINLTLRRVTRPAPSPSFLAKAVSREGRMLRVLRWRD